MPEHATPYPNPVIRAVPRFFLASLALLGIAAAQPVPAPTTGDLKCKEDVAVVATDTVVSGGVDRDGYFPLFDGTFKGWFQSCRTDHSGGSTEGGIFRIGQADGRPAIYTTQRGTITGGVMMTNKKYGNYEITFETWPDYGNDAGLFNRTPINGRCFQTVLDYIGGASVGGSWGEGGFIGRDFRPFNFSGDEKTIAIPGLGNGEMSDWTIITRKLKATTEPGLPCGATGCTQADWRTLWDFDGWNQIKVQFYGGTASNTGNIHMKSWFKKPSSSVWVPVLQDTTLNMVIPAGYIGIQVHNNGRFGGVKGTWYRDIRWKPLDNNGVPTPQLPMPGSALQAPAPRYSFAATGGVLTGAIDQDYRILVQDTQGRTLESFAGKAGPIRRAFATDARGVLMIRIETAHSLQTVRVFRGQSD